MRMPSVTGVLWLCCIVSPASAQAVAKADRTRSPVGAQVPQAVSPLDRLVTVMLQDVPLIDAIRKIDREADLRLGYTDRIFPAGKRVTLVAEKISAGKALARVLEGTGLMVRVSADNQLTIVREPRTPGPQASGTIVGRVTDGQTGGRLVGVEVFLDGTRWRTATDTAGRYRLVDVDSGAYTLTARRLGYKKQSRPVHVDAGREDTLDIALEQAAAKLDELVATATGQQRRRDLGNAITTIRADSVLQTAPIRSLTDLLENRVPGLTVQHTSGAPGDPAKLRLRGLGSALRSNDPVVIVDGVRIYANQSSARSGNLTNLDPGTNPTNPIRVNPVNVPAPSPLDQIDPNTIDKIEVFKGPSAATLYGADAANGVIVITTKRGRPGPTRWSANVTQARTTSPGQYPTGYYRWGSDAQTGVSRFCTLIDVTCTQDSLVQFQALNDPSLTLLGHGRRTGLSLTASGGTQMLTYRITGSYANETGLLTMPTFEVERFRAQFNKEPPDWMRRPHQLTDWSVTSNVTARLSQSADVTLSTSLSRSEQQRTSLEQQLAPMAGTYVDTINQRYYRPVNTQLNVYGLDATPSILTSYYTRQTASTLTFTTGLATQWRPRSWFSASGHAGLNVVPRNDQLLQPSGLLSATDSGSVVHGTGRSLVSTFDFQGTVRKAVGLGFVFETNAGVNLTTENTTDLVTSAQGLIPGSSSISGALRVGAVEAATNTSVYGWYIEPRISGQRLSLSTGLRLDGGSNYGTRVTTGGVGLPKLNGSWVVSEESWFPFKSIFSSLRLRGAYGQAQVQPGATDRLRLYSGAASDGASLFLSTLGNTALRPERSTEFEGGFDADVLDNRVTIEFTSYRKLQVDALMRTALPPSVKGGGSILTNIGNIRNAGVELKLDLTPLRTRSVIWSTQLQYSRNNNKLVKLGNGVAPNPAQGLVEGYPVGSRWVLPIISFADLNHDNVIEPQEIQVGDTAVFAGRLYPAYTSAIFSNLTLFGGAVGVSVGFSYDAGATQVNQTLRQNWVLVRALVDSTVPLSEQAAIWASTRETHPTDYGLMQQISTFRFNSLSINYHAPTSVTRRLRAQQLSVAVQGSNLGLHSSYRGKDPDVNAWSPGENIVDTGQLPLPRTWQLRFDLTY